MVPKKGGFTVIKNEKNELIPTRIVTGWRVCIDYRKFVFLMDTLDITKLLLHLRIKRKPLLHAHLVLLLLGECHLVCVMLLVHSKDA